MTRVLSLVFGTFFMIVWPSVLFGFDNDTVHRDINWKAGMQSGLEEYLKSELFTNEGLIAKFGDKEVLELLEDGGWSEDTTPRPGLFSLAKNPEAAPAPVSALLDYFC